MADPLEFGSPIDRIQFAADVSIRRALLFAALGVGTLMVGLSFEPYLAIKAGAILVTMAAVILTAMGQRAAMRPFERTETWIILDKQHRLGSGARAQQAIGGTLRERYYWHARLIASIALGMWAIALLLWAARWLNGS